jgi:hypothetical protein
MFHARIRCVLAVLAVAGTALTAVDAARAQALWIELTPPQQEALAPLAGQWPQLHPEQQRRWMAVSRRYHRMSPEDRQILQGRMTEWAALSPTQRNQARFTFNASRSRLSPEERRAKWEEYNSLPPADRETLAKNRRVPRGTAPALRPPLPGKLVSPPPLAPPTAYAMPPQANGHGSGPRRAPRALIPADPNTLLPRLPPP